MMGGSCALDLGVLLGAVAVLVSPPEVLGVGEPPEHFLFQSKGECHYSASANGTQQRIRYLNRYFWDRQEQLYFDSDRGRVVAVAELSEPEFEAWNKDKDVLRNAMANVEVFCRHNYGVYAPLAHARRVQPKVVITPTEYDSVSHNALLICTVAAFYPAKIEIKWFRNGEEETGVWTTDVTRNGDWTFQIEVMLETQPKRGDVYACQVEHASFAGPVTVQWEAQSDSAKSKMWTGIVGLVLGLVFVAPGLFLCVRNKKGLAVPQSPGLMR
ncbi:H-2 class II histocompatibility antigen, E-S beta chain-like isoform X1 [Rhineura floridana]|uniref:H-2 class II histocompatibility antigen, E-S beta chain-like isoform X1 n=1 Tax=Rhineura floridana TaxID=261503 RepID=UPI002AC8640A|nr:H-2 class II histocompatibility antigen, E-S beta chain-like isoform X1 [Rhineura floridana]